MSVGTAVGSGTLASTGGFTGTDDRTGYGSQQTANEAVSTTFFVNPDGTFSETSGGNAGGVIISPSQVIKFDNAGSVNPTVAIYNLVPGSN